MNKILSFMAGALCGAVVGATVALLLTPASGEELRGEMVHRWEDALNEARQAMEDTRRDLQTQFEMMQQGNIQEEATETE
ncbi:MAG: YtxH domain-containing protein [Chloroflexota bacterium]|nr:MAG: YtxH domain-containing protein [Chloroflexota bacterium]